MTTTRPRMVPRVGEIVDNLIALRGQEYAQQVYALANILACARIGITFAEAIGQQGEQEDGITQSLLAVLFKTIGKHTGALAGVLKLDDKDVLAAASGITDTLDDLLRKFEG